MTKSEARRCSLEAHRSAAAGPSAGCSRGASAVVTPCAAARARTSRRRNSRSADVSREGRRVPKPFGGRRRIRGGGKVDDWLVRFCFRLPARVTRRVRGVSLCATGSTLPTGGRALACASKQARRKRWPACSARRFLPSGAVAPTMAGGKTGRATWPRLTGGALSVRGSSFRLCAHRPPTNAH
jgi:hypothetical protein